MIMMIIITKMIISTRLTKRQQMANMWFQNVLWFSINSLVIVGLTTISKTNPTMEFATFWPFTTTTFSFVDNKVFKVIHLIMTIMIMMMIIMMLKVIDFIASVIIVTGLVSLVLLWKVGLVGDGGQGEGGRRDVRDDVSGS